MIDWDLVDQRVAEGYIQVRKHPDFDLWIYNYTSKAQFDHVWDEATMTCRGLIVDADKRVVARGFEKFFNHDQVEAPKFARDDLVHVADKSDGSLGILYPTPDGKLAVATRGSFTSDQALHATALWQTLGWEKMHREGYTQLFEILYKENRIVLDYGELDELRLLGRVDNEQGYFYPTKTNVSSFGRMTYGEAMALPPRPNAEGLVLTREDDGAMVKRKQESYLRLHRIIFGLSARTLWEIMVKGDDVDAYIESLPDEFQGWATDVVDELDARVTAMGFDYEQEFLALEEDLDDEFGGDVWTKADLARRVSSRDDAWAMFMLYDGKDLYPTVLKNNKPAAFQTPIVAQSEDTA